MASQPNRLFHARFILAAADRYALYQVRFAGDHSPDRERFVGWALPHALFGVAGLRMALEYVAHEAQERFLPGCDRESTFPICKDRHSFDSVMGSRFPGLEENHRDVWEAFLRVQPFSDGGYQSLGTLNELWNHSKHVDLEGTMTHELLMTFEDPSAGAKEEVRKYFLTYSGGRPLLELLDRCVKDVGAVLEIMEPFLRVNAGPVAPTNAPAGSQPKP